MPASSQWLSMLTFFNVLIAHSIAVSTVLQCVRLESLHIVYGISEHDKNHPTMSFSVNAVAKVLTMTYETLHNMAPPSSLWFILILVHLALATQPSSIPTTCQSLCTCYFLHLEFSSLKYPKDYSPFIISSSLSGQSQRSPNQ